MLGKIHEELRPLHKKWTLSDQARLVIKNLSPRVILMSSPYEEQPLLVSSKVADQQLKKKKPVLEFTFRRIFWVVKRKGQGICSS